MGQDANGRFLPETSLRVGEVTPHQGFCLVLGGVGSPGLMGGRQKPCGLRSISCCSQGSLPLPARMDQATCAHYPGMHTVFSKVVRVPGEFQLRKSALGKDEVT